MATKIYQPRETPLVWKSSGGDAAFTPTSLATVSGRQGTYLDRGESSVARDYNWRAWIKPGGTRVVGEVVEIYLLTGETVGGSARYDNDDGTTDAAVSAYDKLRNSAFFLGVIQIDENAAVEMTKSGSIYVPQRYVAPAFWNATANTLSSTAGDFGFSLTPVPDESQ